MKIQEKKSRLKRNSSELNRFMLSYADYANEDVLNFQLIPSSCILLVYSVIPNQMQCFALWLPVENLLRKFKCLNDRTQL